MRLFRRHDLTALALRPQQGELLPPESPPTIRIRLNEGQDVSSAPTGTHEIQTPVGAARVETHVTVPVAQAAITAGAALILAAVAAWTFGWHIRAVLGAFALVLLAAWLWRLDKADRLLWQVETFTGWDINNDGVRGKPKGTVLVNAATARATADHLAQSSALSDEQQALVAFLRRCYSRGTTERAHGVTATGPGRAAYVKHRDTLLGLGIAGWKHEHHRDGWELRVAYDEAVKLLAGHTL